MEGQFYRNKQDNVLAAIILLVGIMLTVTFCMDGVRLIREQGTVAEVIACFFLVLISLVIGCSSAVVFFNYRGAFLRVSDGILEARCGVCRRFRIRLEDLRGADVRDRVLVFFTDRECYRIKHLRNAREFCLYLKPMICRTEYSPELCEVARKEQKKIRRRYISLFASGIAGGVLMVALAICFSTLTGWRELKEFDSRDSTLFCLFLLGEILLVSVSLGLAVLGRKQGQMLANNRMLLSAVLAHENRWKGLEEYEKIDSVRCFCNGTLRVITLREEGGYAMMLDVFNEKREVWEHCYMEPEHYPSRKELKDAEQLLFKDEIFEDEG